MPSDSSLDSSNLNDRKEVQKIFFALIAGLILGLMIYFAKDGYLGEGFKSLGAQANNVVGFLNPVGAVFVKLLRMVVVPLVFASIFMAVINLGHPSSLGTLGVRAIVYYTITTSIAVLFGLIVVNIINPGEGASLSSAGLDQLNATMAAKVQGQKGLFATIVEVLLDAIPSNPFDSLANAKILQIIVFSLVLGLVGLFTKEKSQAFIAMMGSLEEMTLTLTHWIMRLAPIGIFVLMLEVISNTGLDAIYSLSKYMLTVLVGLFFHGTFLLTLASWRAKKSPIFILRGMSQSLLTAFTTASSAATLPITMANVEDNLGVRKDTAKFVLPLGATINMDGTALYESVAAIFIAQAYGIELGVGQQMIIFFTASLAAIGAAAIPGAGLITMSIVLTAVGLPLEGIGLILAVDRILDMFRTTINVFGDAVGTIVVDSIASGENNKL